MSGLRKRETIITDGIRTVYVNLDNVDDLVLAMRFKAENIKAKAEPELFNAVAYELSMLSDVISIIQGGGMSE